MYTQTYMTKQAVNSRSYNFSKTALYIPLKIPGQRLLEVCLRLNSAARYSKHVILAFEKYHEIIQVTQLH